MSMLSVFVSTVLHYLSDSLFSLYYSCRYHNYTVVVLLTFKFHFPLHLRLLSPGPGVFVVWSKLFSLISSMCLNYRRDEV